ncbi:DoxX family protein [Sphingomonas sp. HT-1]|uniref:DoxX family protein n=1 Tax=unclassified Sphingomonas TaxID=196159 RepID=UPI00030111DB|nr:MULTISPECIES: DoxX family protein [unclassified Sphingomonas]KTF68347.1 DoxX family protein [Sphingomonas sp. WG]
MIGLRIHALLATRGFAVAATALLTLPYWTSGIAKMLDPAGALQEAEYFHLQPAAAIVTLTILVQLVGSLLLILGRLAWLGAGMLGVFTALATILAHPFWESVDPVARLHARNTFLEHVGLIGGLMFAAIVRARGQ